MRLYWPKPVQRQKNYWTKCANKAKRTSQMAASKNKPKTDDRLDALDTVLQRLEARQAFMPYCRFVAPWYKPGRHHYLVAEKLEQVIRYIETGGKEGIGRLIVNMPFRHGKSEEVSRLLPSYLLGKLPDKRVILTSYGADLAEDDSRKVRDYVD